MLGGGATGRLAYFLCRSPTGAPALRVTWFAINLDVIVVTSKPNVTSRTKCLPCPCTCRGKLDNLVGRFLSWDSSGISAPESLLSTPSPVPKMYILILTSLEKPCLCDLGWHTKHPSSLGALMSVLALCRLLNWEIQGTFFQVDCCYTFWLS